LGGPELAPHFPEFEAPGGGAVALL